MSIPCKMRPAGLESLPLGYTRLEYLQGNPNTQINIPYATNADTGLAAEYMQLGNRVSNSVLVASDSSILSMFVPYSSLTYPNDTWLFRYGRYDYSLVPGYKELEYLTGSVNYLNSKIGTTVLNGITRSYKPYTIAFDGFANNLQVLKDFYRLRWAKVSQGDQVVMHLIPALDPEQRPCLYDLVQKKTYYNSGSGKFAYNVSEEYTPVDYLETTGGQYTRAAIVPRPNIGCRTSFSVSQQINYPIICAAKGTNYAYYLFAAANVAPGYSYIRWGSADGVNTRAWFNIGEESVQELNWLNSKVVKGNGTQIHSLNSDTSFNIGLDLYLFASNAGGTVNSVNSGARLYSVEFSEYSTVIRHFVPALDSVGAPCFVETMSGIPFYNLGTGDFLYPGKETEVTTYSLRRPQTYAQMTANGIRRLYHVPKGYNGTKEEYAAEYGFKPLIETPQPEEGYWTPHWKETKEEIVLEWIETDPPEDIPSEEP